MTYLDPVKDFLRAFDRLHNHSVSKRDMFRDMLELWYCAYAKLMASTPERAESLEARYMSIVRRYKNPDVIRGMKPLLEMLFDALEGGGRDFLGEISSQLEILDARNGQFFTPYNVSQMMARITLDGFERVIAEQGYITICEPASGAGGMILACANVLQEMGYNPMTHMLVQATDVSPMCFHMCYMQFTARGIPAAVFHGDTLRMEVYESAWTVHAHVFQGVHGHLFDRPEMQQLSIFDFELAGD